MITKILHYALLFLRAIGAAACLASCGGDEDEPEITPPDDYNMVIMGRWRSEGHTEGYWFHADHTGDFYDWSAETGQVEDYCTVTWNVAGGILTIIESEDAGSDRYTLKILSLTPEKALLYDIDEDDYQTFIRVDRFPWE